MTDLDLRPVQREDHRETIFEMLDDANVGETATLVTDGDAGVFLHYYQIKRRRRLQWDSEERNGDEREIRVTKGESLAENDLVEFDVRDMPPQRRHEILTDTFDRLEPDEGFVLVNDHDPEPLYHELRSTRGEGFEWEYTNQDPQEWCVEIVKTDETESMSDDVVASFDVREIPKAERHSTVHHRYCNIGEGETMEIIAPHEPRSLRREFQQRYGDSSAWEILENEPGCCRVRITKKGEEAPPDDAPATSPNGDSLTVTRELDIRNLPPAQRHEQIFDAYANLLRGEGFVLVNDHDPEPLYHQFDAEAGNEFYWEYRQQEPGEFRVLIGKDDAIGSGTTGSERFDSPF